MIKEISSREKEIIIGTILGDTHVAVLKNGARLEFTHSDKQKDYLIWKHKEMRRWTTMSPREVYLDDARYGKVYKQWRFSTNTDRAFSEFHDLFYKKKIKIVPKSICSLLTSPLSLAVWFMDDGGRRNDSYGLFLNTLSFKKGEQEMLINCLKTNFSLECRTHWVQDGYRIYIPSDFAKHFCELVSPFVIPSMRYKLSFDPVTTSYARLDRARDRKSF